MFRWLKDLWQKGAPKPAPEMPVEPPAGTPQPAQRAPRPTEPPRAAEPGPRQRPAGGRSAHAPGRTAGTSFDRRSYDVIAEDYERVHAPYTSQPVRELLEHAGARTGLRVLDVGTGTALAVDITQEVVGTEGLAIGVDPAVRMLEVAHATRPGRPLAAAQVLDLPFADETFDLVVANFVLPYLRKLDTALFEIKRVLRSGGHIAVSVYTDHEDDLTRTWRLLAEEAIGPDVLRAGIKEEIPWAARLGDAKRLEGVLRDDGFRPVRVTARKYRFEVPREDYIVGHEIEATGRFIHRMLGPQLWERFRERTRQRYAERFPEQLLDFRDVLLAVGTKPA